jgi:hypothetical protein
VTERVGTDKRRKGVPTASSAAALKRMKSTGRRDTAPEVALRVLLYRRAPLSDRLQVVAGTATQG